MSARFMRLILCCGSLALAVAAVGQGPASAAQPGSVKTPDLPRVVDKTVAKTNDFRREYLRHPLVVNPELTRAAQYFAKYLAEKDQLSHTADGQEPWDRAKKFGYEYCLVEENIAYEFNSAGFATDELAEAFVKGWENSPGHRKNMLNRYVTDTGVAVARREASGKYYAVQMFGRPKSKEIEFQVVNNTDAVVKYKVDEQSLTVEPRVRMTHQACTPPDVQFQLPGAKEGGQQVYHPEKGISYIIRGNQGAITVSEQRQ